MYDFVVVEPLVDEPVVLGKVNCNYSLVVVDCVEPRFLKNKIFLTLHNDAPNKLGFDLPCSLG